MDAAASIEAVSKLAAALDTLLAPPEQSTEAEWGRSVARAVCDLMRCEGAKLSVRTPTEPRTFSYGTTDRRPPHAAVVRVSATIADGGVHIALTCHLREAQSTPRDVGQWQAVLDLLRPALAAAARIRFSPYTRDTIARLLDALDEPVAACAWDGRVVHENEVLRRLLAAEPRDSELRREIVRAGTVASHAASRHAVGFETVTPDGSYQLIARRVAGAPGDELALVKVRRAEAVDVLLAAGELGGRYGLSPRETDVARLLVAGRSNTEIARALGISEPTARHHTQRVLEKLGVRSRAAVASVVIARTRNPGVRTDPVAGDGPADVRG